MAAQMGKVVNYGEKFILEQEFVCQGDAGIFLFPIELPVLPTNGNGVQPNGFSIESAMFWGGDVAFNPLTMKTIAPSWIAITGDDVTDFSSLSKEGYIGCSKIGVVEQAQEDLLFLVNKQAAIGSFPIYTVKKPPQAIIKVSLEGGETNREQHWYCNLVIQWKTLDAEALWNLCTC